MAKVQKTVKLDPEIDLQIRRIAQAQRLPYNAVLEELLVQALAEQESELAASFLIPKIQDAVNVAVRQQADRLGKLMARTAIESSIAAHLTLMQFQMMQPERYTPEVLANLRNNSWEQSFLNLKRKNKDAEQVLSLLSVSDRE